MITLNKLRGKLYRTAKILGDVQAVAKAQRNQSVEPIAKRVARRAAGKITGRILGRLFK